MTAWVALGLALLALLIAVGGRIADGWHRQSVEEQVEIYKASVDCLIAMIRQDFAAKAAHDHMRKLQPATRSRGDAAH